jgi:hypothetical protein
MHKLHSWVDEEGHEWYCLASNHGPRCRSCIDLDGFNSLGIEEISVLLYEIEQRDELIDKLRVGQVGLCRCDLDHSGMRPHTKTKNCMDWMELVKESN